MTKKLLFLFLILFSISCKISRTKYDYSYEMGISLELSKGKWILNKPYTNYNKYTIYDIAYEGFKEILGDSLYEISIIRNDKLIAEQYPYELSVNELKELKLITNCDFIINVKSNITKDETGSLGYNRGNENEKETNQAYSEIRIYDLNALILISEVSVNGSTTNFKNPDDSGFTVMNTSSGVLVKGLKKLIRKYKKNEL